MPKSKFYKKHIRPIKHRFAYNLVMILIFFVRLLPRRLSIKLCVFFARLYSKLPTRNLRRAKKSVSVATENSYNLPKDLIGDCFAMAGQNTVIVIRLTKDLPKLTVDFKCKATFDKLYEEGKGVIVVTGHIGPFELIPAYLANMGYKISVVGKRLFERRIDSYLVKTRESFGTVNVQSDDSPRKLIKLLKEGYALGILPDVNTKSVAFEQIEFFGKKTRTAVGPVALARVTGLPILPMAIYTKSDYSFELICLEEFNIAKTDNKDDDIARGLKEMNTAIEKLIMKDPTQWIWFHPRFKG